MGRNWLEKLCLNWRNFFNDLIYNKNKNSLNNLEHDNSVRYIINKFKDVFKEDYSSPIKNFSAEIVIEPNATPIFHKGYTVPYGMRDRVEAEIRKFVSAGILEPVQYSRWASPIVVVEKKNKELRICVDCKVTLNKYVKTNHYPLPKIDDLFVGLENCSVFCILDLAQAYQQLAVTEASKELLTINTHIGLFRSTRLVFGVSSAPAIFQSVMDNVLLGISNVKCYLDDILIGATGKNECMNKLNEVLSRLNEHNIKVNLNKCEFFKTSVEYCGHLIQLMEYDLQIRK